MNDSEDMAAEERFRRLFDAHWAAVVRYAARRSSQVDPEDVAATVFSNAWRHLDEVPEHAELPWLLTAARNSVVSTWRKTRRTTARADIGDDVDSTREPDVGLELDVQRALAHLSDDDREVLALTYWDGLDTSTAASVLGCSPGTYRVRLHRARRRLKRHLRPLVDPTAAMQHDTATSTGGTS